MSHAACQQADGLHLPGTLQLALQIPLFGCILEESDPAGLLSIFEFSAENIGMEGCAVFPEAGIS